MIVFFVGVCVCASPRCTYTPALCGWLSIGEEEDARKRGQDISAQKNRALSPERWKEIQKLGNDGDSIPYTRMDMHKN